MASETTQARLALLALAAEIDERIGYFSVLYTDGEREYAVTTDDQGNFCELRAGDEDGEPLVGDEAAHRREFGAAFVDALEAARSDWSAAMHADVQVRADRDEHAAELNAQARRESFAAGVA